jgi:hypothetical protein
VIAFHERALFDYLTLELSPAWGQPDVGHGADAIGFWQWRSALNGQAQYAGPWSAG